MGVGALRGDGAHELCWRVRAGVGVRLRVCPVSMGRRVRLETRVCGCTQGPRAYLCIWDRCVSEGIHARICVCVHVFASLCLQVRVLLWVALCVFPCVSELTCAHVSVCMYVRIMSLDMCVYMPMYVCM